MACKPIKATASILLSWRALFLHISGRNEDSLRLLTEHLKKNPDNVYCHRLLGIINFRTKKYNEAKINLLEAKQQMSSKHKDFSDLCSYIALSFYELGDLDNAIEFLEIALNTWIRDQDFKKRDILYRLGRMFLEKSEYKKALQVFSDGYKLDPENADMLFGFGISLFENGRKNEATEKLLTAIDLDPALEQNKTMKRLMNELMPDNIMQ